MSSSVTQEKLEKEFLFYLNNNRSRKGKGIGREKKGRGKGFRVWSNAMWESVQILGFSIPLRY
jgi:hypothetical protein